MGEDILCIVRSDRHLQYIQSWINTQQSEDVRLSPIDANSEDNASQNIVQSAIFPHLNTDIFGGIILYKESLISTQTILRETLKPSAPPGVVCYTNNQTQGKGRGENTWTSPEGCLTFSFKSTFKDGASLPFVQYLVSLSIIKAVERIQPSGSASNLVQIKWPNDIYVDKNVKIGGILCQSEYQNGQFDVTTGIGLNISNRMPTTCLQDVLSNETTVCSISKEEFLAVFCNEYEPMEKLFKEQGFGPFESEYIQRWLHSDQIVKVSEAATASDSTSHSVSTSSAIIKGLTSTGCLLAEDTENGNQLELYPDGNTFDFLSGLLKRKL